MIQVTILIFLQFYATFLRSESGTKIAALHPALMKESIFSDDRFPKIKRSFTMRNTKPITDSIKTLMTNEKFAQLLHDKVNNDRSLN